MQKAAMELKARPHTLRKDVRKLFKRYGAENVAQLAAIAVRRGVVK